MSNNPAKRAGLFFFATVVESVPGKRVIRVGQSPNPVTLRALFPGTQRDENRAWLSRRHDVAGNELGIGTVEDIADANVGIERTLRPR